MNKNKTNDICTNGGFRVLFLATEMSRNGGVETYTFNLVSAIAQIAPHAQIDVVVLRNKVGDALPIDDFANVNIQSCGSGSRLFTILRFIGVMVWRLCFWEYDFVMANHIDVAKPYAFLSRIFRLPFGVVAYGIDVWNLGRIPKWVLRNAKVIASISSFTTDKMIKQMNSLLPVVYLPPMVDMHRFTPQVSKVEVLERHGFRLTDKVVLCVCRFSKSEAYKGYDNLIDIWPDVVKRVANAKLLLVGKGDDLGRAKSMASESSESDSIIFAGYVDDELLPGYYSESDLFVMPSRGEGFGIVFIESLACGTPVIAGNCDGSVDAVAGGELGRLVDPASSDEIINAIVDELSGDSKFKDAEFLHRKVEEKFGIEAFKGRVGCFLEELKIAAGIV